LQLGKAMFSALSSLIWGTEQDEPANVETTSQQVDEHLEVENEWIYIQPKVEKSHSRKQKLRTAHFDDAASTTSEASTTAGMEESWLVTPPQCFNDKLKRNRTEVSPMENLLIEHPSMSIYHGSEETPATHAEDSSTKETTIVSARRDTHKAVAGRLLALEKRQPLKEMNAKASITRKQSSSKNLKRRNQVLVRQHVSRKNKQYGRMTGKHTALVAKRGAF